MFDVTKFTGLISAPATPTLINGDINTDVIGKYAKHLVSIGVLGVYVNGTTGEGPSFTVDERKKSAEEWVRVGVPAGIKLVIVQVGGCNFKESQELAAHAQSIGAHAIATLPPLFFKPTSVDELVLYCKDVASAAPNLPFYYYHFPDITQVNVSIPEFLTKGTDLIPTLVGVKFTSIDIQQSAVANSLQNGRFHILQGYDELLGPSLIAGGKAAVGASYNFTGISANKLIECYNKKDMDGFVKEQAHLSQVIATIRKYNAGFAGLKTVIDLLTPFPIGPPRSPLRPVSAEIRQGLANDLKSLGYKVYMS